jgi:plasmid maintenance system antidote protein VapI
MLMTREARMRLVKPHTMRDLMGRTGDGSEISGRKLAEAVGVPHGTIEGLLNGKTKTQPAAIAREISRVIGVDVGCLWAETGRKVPDEQPDSPPAREAVSV